jgi:beta-mannosidase
MRAKVIGDPYHGLNDFDLRWIAWANWTYQTTLQLRVRSSSEFLSQDSTSEGSSSAYSSDFSSEESEREELSSPNYYLLFNGLDTFADIDLCGTRVASTNNQFRQYHFNVSRIVQQCNGPRVLTINFGSAAAVAKNISELPGQETWPGGVEGIFEFQHRQFVRKEQNDFGWDWGPAFVPAGIWQPAYLLALGEGDVHIRNTLVDVYREGQVPLLPPAQNRPWVVNASIDVVGRLPSDASMIFTLTAKGGKSHITGGSFSNIVNEGTRITGNTTISVKLVDLWWPHNLGTPNLYSLQMEIMSKNKTIASVTKTVGFRTIVLNQEPIRDEQRSKGIAPGANWHFEINGNEFYAKGSNFIPPDTFWTRVTPERIRRLFDMVVRGNQNMLRIWSSGAYLPDFAYDIADGECNVGFTKDLLICFRNGDSSVVRVSIRRCSVSRR